MTSGLSRSSETLSFWPPFVDTLFMVILFLFFYILVEFFANSEIFILIDLRKRQKLVLETFQHHFATQFKNKIIRVKPEGDTQRFSFSDRVLFDSGKSDLKSSGEELLAQFLKILQQHHREFLQVQVIGHTDNVPLKGVRQDNWSLSANRAVAVVRYAIKAEFPTQNLSATGYGEYQPVASNDTEEGKRLNRRIEILLVYKRRENFSQLTKQDPTTHQPTLKKLPSSDNKDRPTSRGVQPTILPRSP